MNWLLVERYDNWKVDQGNDFAYLGVSPKKLKTAQRMNEGDTLITYVSGVKAFSDIRRIESVELIKLKVQYDYDEPFNVAIKTSPILVLDETNWVSVYDALDKLSFTKGKKRWSNYFYHQLKLIKDSNDANTLIKLIESKNKSRTP
ncbi:hypothetical protein ROM75_002400 [Vibrio vulnificus]|nr:hypothetical protein [Vibrio vulnificus]